MSEVAARSNTAIGSLYRFFPTKDALAEALLDRFVGDFGATLDTMRAQAPTLTAAQIADTLVNLMLDLRDYRAAAVALLDGRADAPNRRAEFRSRVRGGITSVLMAAGSGFDASRAAVCAAVTLQIMKGAPVLAAETGEGRDAMIIELREALRLYLVHCIGR